MNQSRMDTRWLLLPGIAILTVAALLFSGSLTSAQTPDATATPALTQTPGATPDSLTPTPIAGASDMQTYDEILADELGVSVNELREAQANARDRYFEQLEQAGKLTAEQAANLKATSPGDLITSLMDFDHQLVRRVVMARVAEIIGIDRQTLEQELGEGRSLDDIAEERGVSTAEIRSELEATADQLIGIAQQAGMLSSSEAENLRDNLQRMLDRLTSSGTVPAPTPAATP